jgi:hypothetical protein
MMERLDDIAKADRQNKPAIPSWVRDAEWNNFGRNTAGVIKLRDYANPDLAEVLTRETQGPFRLLRFCNGFRAGTRHLNVKIDLGSRRVHRIGIVHFSI